MSDPFSITAGVVGITVAALHSVRLLLDDLQHLNDASKTIRRLLEDVRSVEAALGLLQSVENREWELLGPGVSKESENTIISCTQACTLFHTEIQRWTKHSSDGKLVWADRAKVGFFKQGQIKAMSEQLQNCRLAINSIISIATLYSSVRHRHITEDIKKTISEKQEEVKGVISTTDKQLIILDDKLERLSLSSDDENVDEPAEDKARALLQYQEERKAIVASRKLLDELLDRAQEEAVAKAAAKDQASSTTLGNVTFGNQNSGVQTGVLHGGIHGAVFGGKRD